MEIEKKMISIITVTFNRVNSLLNTIDSVLNQDFKNFEYIIYDGNSNDGTVDLITSYKEKFLKRGITYKFISESDRGMVDAFNKATKLCSGDYIGICNSDDQLLPNVLSKISSIIIKNPNQDIYHGNILVKNEIKKPNSNLNIYGNIIAFHPAAFIKRTVFEEIGYYDENFGVAADKELFIRAHLNGKTFFKFDIAVANYCLGGGSNQNPKLLAKLNHKIRVKYGFNSIKSYLIYIKIIFKQYLKDFLNRLKLIKK